MVGIIFFDRRDVGRTQRLLRDEEHTALDAHLSVFPFDPTDVTRKRFAVAQEARVASHLVDGHHLLRGVGALVQIESELGRTGKEQCDDGCG